MKISKEWTGERAGREERAKSGIREIQGKSIIFSA